MPCVFRNEVADSEFLRQITASEKEGVLSNYPAYQFQYSYSNHMLNNFNREQTDPAKRIRLPAFNLNNYREVASNKALNLPINF